MKRNFVGAILALTLSIACFGAVAAQTQPLLQTAVDERQIVMTPFEGNLGGASFTSPEFRWSALTPGYVFPRLLEKIVPDVEFKTPLSDGLNKLQGITVGLQVQPDLLLLNCTINHLEFYTGGEPFPSGGDFHFRIVLLTNQYGGVPGVLVNTEGWAETERLWIGTSEFRRIQIGTDAPAPHGGPMWKVMGPKTFTYESWNDEKLLLIFSTSTPTCDGLIFYPLRIMRLRADGTVALNFVIGKTRLKFATGTFTPVN